VNASEPPPYAPSWYTATMVQAQARPPLTYDLDVDVCVVGAGLAGITTAREIARRGWSVAVLERGRIAWNASGRNDGFVLPGFAASMDRIISRVGLDHARALWALSDMGVKYVRTAIAEERMPGVAPIAGWLKASKVDNGEEVLADAQFHNEQLGVAAEAWTTERVRSVLRTNHYFYALHLPHAFHIHPLNYALGLVQAAEAAGARFFEDTPALAIDVEGVRKRVITPSARVRAGHIVLAGNVHLGALMPRVAGTLMPIWSYVITTAPLGAQLGEAIGYRGAVTDTDLANSHYRVVGGDRLMWSGHSTTWDGNPARVVPRLQAEIAAIYPQLGNVPVEYAWSGVLGNSLHRMPQIGELAPGLWLASGFGGHGLNTTAMAGAIIARAIHEGDDTWRLFAPFELVWAGGGFGRAAAQVHYWWYRWRERTRAHWARRREAQRRRDEERESVAPLEYEPEANASVQSAAAAPPSAFSAAEPLMTARTKVRSPRRKQAKPGQ
jgi:gamma-glutamylputrescine oxidase